MYNFIFFILPLTENKISTKRFNITQKNIYQIVNIEVINNRYPDPFLSNLVKFHQRICSCFHLWAFDDFVGVHFDFRFPDLNGNFHIHNFIHHNKPWNKSHCDEKMNEVLDQVDTNSSIN